MKSVRWMAGVVLGVCVAGGVVAVAQPQPEPSRPARGERQPQRELTSVDSAMKLVNRSVRRLKAEIADPEKKEENLKLVGEVERAIVFAKGQPLPDVHKAGNGARGAPARNSVAGEQPEPKRGAE